MTHPTVLFDFDHTLIDSDRALALAYVDAAEAGAIADPERWRSTFEEINHALWRGVERGALSANEVKHRRFEALLIEVGATDPASMSAVADDMAEAFVVGLVEHIEFLPGAVELLDGVGARQLGLVTNGIGRVQRGRLERLGLVDHFETVVISGERGVAKPDPAIFGHALAELGNPSIDDVVMVGDNWSSDIQGALNAGLASIWLAGGDQPTEPPPESVRVAATLTEVAVLLG